MQINSVLSGCLKSALSGGQAESVEPLANQAKDVASSTPGASAANALAGELVADYDITDITPDEFSELISRLEQIGLLSDAECRQLGQVRLDLQRAGIEPDDSVNLLEFYAGRIDAVQRDLAGLGAAEIAASDKSGMLGELRSRLEWVEKFALIQESPDSVGLDSLA